MGTVSFKSEAASRSVRMLRTAMGPAITGWLEDPAIVEIMLNPDGRFLPWAALVAEGIVLNKDGSFQRTAHFRGPDLESATPAELVGATARLNNALRRLGSGWAIFVRSEPVSGPGLSGQRVSRSGIDAGGRRTGGSVRGRRGSFRERLLLDVRVPAAARGGGAGRTSPTRAASMSEASTRTRFSGASSTAPIGCCSSSRASCRKRPGSPTARRVPEAPMYLDAVLIDELLVAGLARRVGKAHLRTLTVMGFPWSPIRPRKIKPALTPYDYASPLH
jgi:type IV secretion system protein TrbE